MRIRAVKTVMVRDGAFNVHVFDCIGLYECARISVSRTIFGELSPSPGIGDCLSQKTPCLAALPMKITISIGGLM